MFDIADLSTRTYISPLISASDDSNSISLVLITYHTIPYHWLCTISWLQEGFGLKSSLVLLTTNEFELFYKNVFKVGGIQKHVIPISKYREFCFCCGWSVCLYLLIRHECGSFILTQIQIYLVKSQFYGTFVCWNLKWRYIFWIVCTCFSFLINKAYVIKSNRIDIDA